MDEIAADWIFDNGRVLTLDPRGREVRALAVAVSWQSVRVAT